MLKISCQTPFKKNTLRDPLKNLPQSVKRALKRRNFLCGATDAAKSTTRQLTSFTISVRTLVQPRHTLVQPRHTLVQPRHTLVQPRHTLVQPRHTLVQPRHTLVQPIDTLVFTAISCSCTRSISYHITINFAAGSISRDAEYTVKSS
jgi:hypothetical protein